MSGGSYPFSPGGSTGTMSVPMPEPPSSAEGNVLLGQVGQVFDRTSRLLESLAALQYGLLGPAPTMTNDGLAKQEAERVGVFPVANRALNETLGLLTQIESIVDHLRKECGN